MTNEERLTAIETTLAMLASNVNNMKDEVRRELREIDRKLDERAHLNGKQDVSLAGIDERLKMLEKNREQQSRAIWALIVAVAGNILWSVLTKDFFWQGAFGCLP